LDVLVPQVRSHGVGPHLPARRCRSAARVGNQAAELAVRRQRGAPPVQQAGGARDPAELLRLARRARERQGGAEGPLGALGGSPPRALSPPPPRRVLPSCPPPPAVPWRIG